MVVSSGKRYAGGRYTSAAQSLRQDDMPKKSAFARGGEGEACSYMRGSKRGKVCQNLRLGHSAGKILKHVGDGDSGSFDTRLATADPRRDRDVLCNLQIHDAGRPVYQTLANNIEAEKPQALGAAQEYMNRIFIPADSRADQIKSRGRPPG